MEVFTEVALAWFIHILRYILIKLKLVLVINGKQWICPFWVIDMLIFCLVPVFLSRSGIWPGKFCPLF